MRALTGSKEEQIKMIRNMLAIIHFYLSSLILIVLLGLDPKHSEAQKGLAGLWIRFLGHLYMVR